MMPDTPQPTVVVLISATEEWNAAMAYFGDPTTAESPFGEFTRAFFSDHSVILVHGGWGKISAAAGTQYAIDRWHPDLLINIGTCGGFEGDVTVGEVILASGTLIYDIHERMGNPQEALDFYTTPIDISRLRRPLPQPVRSALLLSADEDIDPARVAALRSKYGAIAADWESGAIAWTCRRNGVRVLILRAVSDLVNDRSGELYEGGDFTKCAQTAMLPLLEALPGWVRCAFPGD